MAKKRGYWVLPDMTMRAGKDYVKKRVELEAAGANSL
jgi:hypothetical protein